MATICKQLSKEPWLQQVKGTFPKKLISKKKRIYDMIAIKTSPGSCVGKPKALGGLMHLTAEGRRPECFKDAWYASECEAQCPPPPPPPSRISNGGRLRVHHSDLDIRMRVQLLVTGISQSPGGYFSSPPNAQVFHGSSIRIKLMGALHVNTCDFLSPNFNKVTLHFFLWQTLYPNLHVIYSAFVSY